MTTLQDVKIKSVSRASDTTELIGEAARSAPCSNPLDSADTTQALLKTFAWIETPDEGTCCLDSTKPSPQSRDEQLVDAIQQNIAPAIKITAGLIKLYPFFCVIFFLLIFFFFTCSKQTQQEDLL